MTKTNSDKIRYAKKGKGAGCRGCKGKITFGQLRWDSISTDEDRKFVASYHLKCVSETTKTNFVRSLQEKFPEDDVTNSFTMMDGFESLKEEHQDHVEKILEQYVTQPNVELSAEDVEWIDSVLEEPEEPKPKKKPAAKKRSTAKKKSSTKKQSSEKASTSKVKEGRVSKK